MRRATGDALRAPSASDGALEAGECVLLAVLRLLLRALLVCRLLRDHGTRRVRRLADPGVDRGQLVLRGHTGTGVRTEDLLGLDLRVVRQGVLLVRIGFLDLRLR